MRLDDLKFEEIDLWSTSFIVCFYLMFQKINNKILNLVWGG